MTLQSRSEPSSDLAKMLSHSPNDINYQPSMGKLEHQMLTYLCDNCFRNKNRTPGSDDFEAIGISQMSWECQTWCISKVEIQYASQGI